jgi:hypothetical protein
MSVERRDDGRFAFVVTVYVDDGNGEHGEHSHATYAESIRAEFEATTLYDPSKGHVVIGVVDEIEVGS